MERNLLNTYTCEVRETETGALLDVDFGARGWRGKGENGVTWRKK